LKKKYKYLLYDFMTQIWSHNAEVYWLFQKKKKDDSSDISHLNLKEKKCT